MRFYSPTTREEILKLVSGVELNSTFDADSLKNVELLTRQNLKFKKKRFDTARPSRILDWMDQDTFPLKGKSIAVIGAGIAGLAAAYELQKYGAQVVIYEANKERIGGRIYTFRKDGLHGEFGAMRIPKEHKETWKYVNLFNIKNREFIHNDKSEKVFINLKNIKAHRLLKDVSAYEGDEQKKEDVENTKQIQLQYSLTTEDFGLIIPTIDKNAPLHEKIWLTIIEEPLKEIKNNLPDPDTNTNPTPEEVIEVIAPYDRISLEQRFEEVGFSTGAKNYTAEMMGLSGYLHTSFAEHLLEEFSKVWLEGFSELDNGMDSLVEEFVQKIGKENIKLGSRVTKLENADHAVVEYVDDSNNLHKAKHDWAICTLPLKILKELQIETAFPPEQIDAINNLSYHSSSKIISSVKKRFWEKNDEIFGGGSITDNCAESTWYPSDNHIKKDPSESNKPSLLLTSYSWGKNAQQIDELAKKNLLKLSHETLEKYHDKSDVEDNLIESFHWSWDQHNKGAFAFCSPMDYTKYHLDLIKKNGKILLAGEHCSFTHSWIQGALESVPSLIVHILSKELAKHQS